MQVIKYRSKESRLRILRSHGIESLCSEMLTKQYSQERIRVMENTGANQSYQHRVKLEKMRMKINLEIKEAVYDESNFFKKSVPPSYVKASGLQRIFFHKGGKPRDWLVNIMKGEDGLRSGAEFIWKKDDEVRLRFKKWIEDNSPKDTSTYKGRIKGLIADKKLSSVKNVHVIHTPHAKYVAEEIVSSLSGTDFVVSTSLRFDPKSNFDLYFVISPNAFDVLPPSDKMICIQLEQVSASNWMTEKYVSTLKSSLAVMDYSQYNIRDLIRLGVDSSQLYFCPIFPKDSRRAADGKDIDVLFYGDTSSARRTHILKEIGKKYNVMHCRDLFGSEMSSILSRAKIVLNIHYYENSILETIRLSEAISHGCKVVSEESLDLSVHDYFEGCVYFARIGDAEDLINKIEQALQSFEKVDLSRPHLGTKFHVLRCLLGLEIIDFDVFCRETIPDISISHRYCLALPEQYHRYKYAINNLLDDAEIFHGLRKLDGWKGCALSYKYLAKLSLYNNLRQLLIYEDDAEFHNKSIELLATSERYIAQFDKEWDVFSGIVTDIHDDANVLDVNEFEGQEFAVIDRPVGMVFMVYSHAGLTKLSGYEVLGENVMIHTVDRFMERGGFTCITPTKPLCMHADFFTSSIWGSTNLSMSRMIERSISKLKSKAEIFKLNRLI